MTNRVGAKNFLLDFLSITVCFLTPFLNFILFHDYSLLSPEIFFVFGFFILIGAVAATVFLVTDRHRFLGSMVRVAVFGFLLTFFIDLQVVFETYTALALAYLGTVTLMYLIRDRINIIILFSGVLVMVTSVIITKPDPLPDFRNVPSKDKPLASAAGPIIHVILDQHLGIEAMDEGLEQYAAVKDDVTAFYERFGFRLYGRAYSWYSSTDQSVPSIFDFGTTMNEKGRIKENETGNEIYEESLANSKYINTLIQREYNIYVYQTDYMNFCPEHTPLLRRCYAYQISSPKVIENLPISPTSKAWILGSMFSSNTMTKALFLSAYYRLLVMFFTPAELVEILRTVEHHPLRNWVSVFDTLSTFEQMLEDAVDAPANSLFLIHFMLPHTPFAYSPDCEIKPVATWVRQQNRFGKNTARSRQIRYGHYFEQVQCTYKLLGDYFQKLKDIKLFDDALIILHGDHGSGISTAIPKVTKNGNVGTPTDVLDRHSVLFAARWPGGANKGYDPVPRPVESLLAEIMGVDPGRLVAPCPNENCVYVNSSSGLKARRIWESEASGAVIEK